MMREGGSAVRSKGRSGMELRGVSMTHKHPHVPSVPSDKPVRIVHLGVARKDKEQKIKLTRQCLW